MTTFGQTRQSTRAGQETMDRSIPVVLPSDQVIDVHDGWVVATITDTTVNDSDKSFVVPAGVERHILNIWVELTTDATVGNRLMVVEIQITGPDVTAQWLRAGVLQAASLTRYYEFAPGLPDDLAFRDTDYLRTPIPTTGVLKAADVLRIFDSKAIASATDDMVVHLQIADRAI